MSRQACAPHGKWWPVPRITWQLLSTVVLLFTVILLSTVVHSGRSGGQCPESSDNPGSVIWSSSRHCWAAACKDTFVEVCSSPRLRPVQPPPDICFFWLANPHLSSLSLIPLPKWTSWMAYRQNHAYPSSKSYHLIYFWIYPPRPPKQCPWAFVPPLLPPPLWGVKLLRWSPTKEEEKRKCSFIWIPSTFVTCLRNL